MKLSKLAQKIQGPTDLVESKDLDRQTRLEFFKAARRLCKEISKCIKDWDRFVALNDDRFALGTEILDLKKRNFFFVGYVQEVKHFALKTEKYLKTDCRYYQNAWFSREDIDRKGVIVDV